MCPFDRQNFREPFVSIGETATKIVERLIRTPHQPEECEHQPEPRHHDDADARQHVEYVSYYLRAVDAFERAASGKRVD